MKWSTILNFCLLCWGAVVGSLQGRGLEAQESATTPLTCGNARLRVVCRQDQQHGSYQIAFQCRATNRWSDVARYADDRPWHVYSDWQDSWYAISHGIRATEATRTGDGGLRVSAKAQVAGHAWHFLDEYHVTAGLIKIDRTFSHLSQEPQSKITLATRVQLPWGDNPRVVIPGSIYNGNPSSTMPGPKLEYKPHTFAAYEEHRLPIPMVNVESSSGGHRIHATLLTYPGRIASGHKGDDHWWSLGLELGHGTAELLSLSGPVATNGQKSTIYGHRNGFDRYDEAYLNIAGQQRIQKTLYLDLGLDEPTGYSFRSALWSAFEIFDPVDVSHVDFNDVMALKVQYAKSTFFRESPGVAGFCAWPWPNRHFQYGWCGGNIAIAYGLLSHALRAGDQQAQQQAVEAINFYAKHADHGVPGMFYGDYFASPVRMSADTPLIQGEGWLPTAFHGTEPAISSRQMGETLERLAESVVLARNMKLDAEADRWQAALCRGCDFLARSPRSEGMFPRAWSTDGAPRGWNGDRPTEPAWLSTAGVYCVGPLVRAAELAEKPEYLQLAESVLDGYWKKFGADLMTPPWGGTHDAGAEDKEAGWGLMKAALDVYEATDNPQYLRWAQLAADWTLTWMYFHDVGLPQSELLRDSMNTVGWTFISTQNQEIDVFGFWMAPDYVRLGQLLNDERYCQIGETLFEASTQTIARDGQMFGQVVRGIQAEHYNHSNCSYVPNGPWRGSQHSVGISWVLASTLYGGAKLAELDPRRFPWRPRPIRDAILPTSQRNKTTWHYTFNRPPDNWTRPEFDDSTWNQGPGGFGEYGTPGSVIGTSWDVNHPQIWLRRRFLLDTVPTENWQLQVHHDDGAKIFVNGVLAANLSTYLTKYQTVTARPEARQALRKGVNVLSVTCEDAAGGRYIDVGLVNQATADSTETTPKIDPDLPHRTD